ncbi:UDP-N-acetylglucosamine--undecaprenyl-phosphate N-acetylglucosamine-1-phosphate transferase [Oceanobacillus picturae]|uniref:UDP-N-acetylglucosamine--undecaprenyl-phosphate N-acetylglucosamine-1-phosphate transferase n=1 Tax=Oceanobacillus picturae TaxID=171693 RepID=W9AL31_9BACI|nr:hypothetical protein [Oceanobacillus picturae]GAQ17721.1 UDP-N-acetylglucosamine--undecaprenyl-phosphate N-acetylglucosamine-1-phosphate transferase [Oceanobacillus picturae]CDO03582.1 hypothetical protein BN988_02098 [Oceanobacillus picturae]
MSGQGVAYAIFSDRYSSLKLTLALLSQVLLFTIFWDIQSNFDPVGLSIMVILTIVMMYRFLKIMVYPDVNKKREKLHLLGTFVIFAMSIYIAIS